MKEDAYVLVSFVIICLFVIWLEWRESNIIDARRAGDFKNLDRSCFDYLRRTKDRPFWRISWVCASLVTIASTIPFAACAKNSSLDAGTYCVMVFAISLVSAQAALSYYTWHILCPHYTCSVCEAGRENSEK